jgi:hypothetical protein
MTAGGTANEAPALPAPGSAVPGAPPALKRALVPADGVPVGAPSLRSDPVEDTGQAPNPPRATNVAGSPLIAAAAMVGIAVGLELAGRLPGARRSPRNRR